MISTLLKHSMGLDIGSKKPNEKKNLMKANMAISTYKWWRLFRSKVKPRYWSIKIGQYITIFLDRFGFHTFFKSLWRRIIIINLLGLFCLIAGILYLNGFRESLLDVKVNSLETHGQIISAVIAATNVPDVNRTDPDNFKDLDTLFPDESNESLKNQSFFLYDQSPLHLEKIAPILQKAVEPTNTRARIYEADGRNVLDSIDFISKGKIILTTPPEKLEKDVKRKGIFYETYKKILDWINYTDVPLYIEIGKANGTAYTEVKTALNGQQTKISRVNNKGQTIVSVATPIKRGPAVLGVLLLTTRGVEIDTAVAAARQEIFRVALVALIVVIISSIYLAGTIAGPMRSLSEGAKSVKKSIKERHQIPDLTHRPDEIGELSSALREMTLALYRRIEAIESFAADVSHELKNPLTSLKSATETLPLARTDEDKKHLHDIILNDVGRLNRLITDISSASRLDAELVRAERKPIDLVFLIKTVADISNDIHHDNNAQVIVDIVQSRSIDREFVVHGHDGRLGQVFHNLLDNALSFSPPDGKVWIRVKRVVNDIEICVEDQGPGIPEDNLNKVFARFYTDRPGDTAFSENSGLGLNISQQIILAHKGEIWAENRYSHEMISDTTSCDQKSAAPKKLGAKLMVKLPAAFAYKGRK